MSTPTPPHLTTLPTRDDVEVLVAEIAAREQRSKRIAYWIADVLAWALRSLLIAWIFDVLRPATGMGWLPHLTWWQVALALMVIGMTAGSITGDVLNNYKPWRDVYGKVTR